MKIDLIKERLACGTYFRWRLQWKEPDTPNRTTVSRLFFGRLFKTKSESSFEATVFKQDVLVKLHIVVL